MYTSIMPYSVNHIAIQVEVKYTKRMVQLDDLERVIGDPRQRMEIIQALDLVLSQSASLKPECVHVCRGLCNTYLYTDETSSYCVQL